MDENLLHALQKANVTLVNEGNREEAANLIKEAIEQYENENNQ